MQSLSDAGRRLIRDRKVTRRPQRVIASRAEPEHLFSHERAVDKPCDAVALLRIGLCYVWRHRRLPRIADPRRFTDLVQARKLAGCQPGQAALLDKRAAKLFAAERLGSEWIIPTIWSGLHLPASLPFACPAILKARHGCNQYAVLERAPGKADWDRLRERSRRWTQRPYGIWLDEPAYRHIPRGLLAEPLLGDAGMLPIDYKVYVFGGRATHVQVHLDRAGEHRWILHDRNWRQLVPGPDRPPAPRSLAAMLDAAETLAAGLGFAQDFVRIDFYESRGRPLFGEFCLYPGSGLDPFAADWIDLELGRLWLAAMAAAKPIFAPVVEVCGTRCKHPQTLVPAAGPALAEPG